MQPETTPDHLKNGPVVDRSCTDILCLVIFMLFTVGMFGLTGYAIGNGDPMRLT